MERHQQIHPALRSIVNEVCPAPSQTETELRNSLAVGTVTWALAQAHLALSNRPVPERITDLHHDERRRFENAALLALMLLNRDAQLYAERSATVIAFETFEQFCKDNGLDWLEDTNVINDDDGLETLIGTCAKKAVQRFTQVLTCTYPGLLPYLTRLEAQRSNDVHE